MKKQAKKTIHYIILIALLFPVSALKADNGIDDRLKGRIILQVESRGEAWYIEPESKERFFDRQ